MVTRLPRGSFFGHTHGRQQISGITKALTCKLEIPAAFMIHSPSVPAENEGDERSKPDFERQSGLLQARLLDLRGDRLFSCDLRNPVTLLNPYESG